MADISIKMMDAHRTNYTRSVNEKHNCFLVIHFTANNGDTARGNAIYFSQANRNASVHYFVDEFEVYKTVSCRDVAWHCGAKTYVHKLCRNSNSIGIELCSRRNAAGVYYFKPETIANAVKLAKICMRAYAIPPENVIRHYDVTGKNCPAPFVASKYNGKTFTATGKEAEAWKAFKEALTK